MTDHVPTPPKGLQGAGKRLWRAVLGPFDLDEWEQQLLQQACRCADRCDELAAVVDREGPMIVTAKGDPAPNPALVESRMQAVTLSRLLASLRLPSGEQEGAMDRPQRRGASRGAYGVRGAV